LRSLNDKVDEVGRIFDSVVDAWTWAVRRHVTAVTYEIFTREMQRQPDALRMRRTSRPPVRTIVT